VPQSAFTAFAVPYLTQAERAPIIEGPDRALWFSEGDSTGNQPSLIGRITAAGVLMQFPRGASGSAAVSGFTNGSDGNIYGPSGFVMDLGMRSRPPLSKCIAVIKLPLLRKPPRRVLNPLNA
jgi:hypothetical protein